MTQSSPRFVPIAGRRSVDCRTRMGMPAQVKATPFDDVWKRVWPRLDELYRSFPGEGVLIAAVVNDSELEAYLHVPLDDLEQRPEFVIVGRHSSCDLRLGRDDSISLRHLVIATQRRGHELRVRLLDLGTDAGLTTEDGQRCCGLGADGAAFVGLGPYHLFILPTGALAPLPWGASAAEAWAAIPDRVYVDRRTAGSQAGRPPRVRLVGHGDGRSIATQILDPPATLRQPKLALGARGSKLGTLTLRTDNASESYEVHAADLERGLLIGRYDRCAFGAEDDRLSRVHLLMVRDGDTCWAVDTASSNGTTAAGTRIRHLQLGAEAELCLARAIALTWIQHPEAEADPSADPQAAHDPLPV